MGAGGVAGAELDGGEAAEGLVGEGGRADGREAEGEPPLHQRMAQRDGRTVQPRRTRLHFAGSLRLDQFQDFLIGIQPVGTDVHDESAQVGNHVVLRPRIDLRHGHLDRPQKVGDLLELLVPEPFDGGKGLVDGIDAGVPCGVSGDAFHRAVQHHQAFLRYDHLQRGRLAEHAAGDGAAGRLDLLQGDLEAVAAAGFLLRGKREDQRVGLRLGREALERLDERHDGCAVVVAPEPVQPAVLDGGRERVPGPSGDGLHRVDVRVDEDDRSLAGGAPEVVAAAVRGEPLGGEPRLEEVGDRLLVPAERGDGDHLPEKVRHNSSSSCRL